MTIKAAGSPEMSVSTFKATWRQIPKDYSLNVLYFKINEPPRFEIYLFILISFLIFLSPPPNGLHYDTVTVLDYRVSNGWMNSEKTGIWNEAVLT